MVKAEPILGLLAQHILREEAPEAKEAERAARFYAQLGIKRQELRYEAAGTFQKIGMLSELEFIRQLYDFAIKNNIIFRHGDWKVAALDLAGRRYIRETMSKRGRGRPRGTQQFGGLLQSINKPAQKGERDYLDVESMMRTLEENGEPCSQIEACRRVAQIRQIEKGRAAHPDAVEAAAKAIEKTVGAYRRAYGKSLPAGRPNGLKIKNKIQYKYRKK